MTAAALIAWHVLYAVACAAALVLGYGAFRKLGLEAPAVWCKELFRGLSHLTASIFTGSSRYSFSAQCYARGRSSWPWRLAQLCVDALLGDNHCQGAAQSEGLL